MAVGTATAISLGLTAAGTAASVGGAIVSHQESKDQAAAMNRASAESVAAQKRAERARRRQAQLQHDRERRSALRRAIIARSEAVSRIGGAGAGFDSSALGGATGAIQSELGSQVSAINQNLDLGEEVFAANEAAAVAGDRFNRARSQVGVGGTIGNIGSTISANFDALNRIGTSFAGRAGPSGIGPWTTTVHRG